VDLRNNSWLSGFADGDGCFSIVEGQGGMSFRFVFTISQRDDHSTALLLLYRQFGGRLNWSDHYSARVNHKSQVNWSLSRKDEILGLIEYFDKYPPIVKKEQYLIWRKAALCYYEHSPGPGRLIPFRLLFKMNDYKAELARSRVYDLNRAIGPADIACITKNNCKLCQREAQNGKRTKEATTTTVI